MATSRETQIRDGVPEHIMREMLEQKRREEEITTDQWYELNPRAELYRDVMKMGIQFRMAWGRTQLHGTTRHISYMLDDMRGRRDGMIEEVLFAMNNVKLKGELFLLRLIKNLPPGVKQQVERVDCGPNTMLRVWFKNGQMLETNEQDIQSDDFWATCGMIYDL